MHSFIDSHVTGADTHAAADRPIAGARGIADATMSKRREKSSEVAILNHKEAPYGKGGDIYGWIALSFFFLFQNCPYDTFVFS